MVYYTLPGSLNQSGYFPLTSLINKTFSPTELSLTQGFFSPAPLWIISRDCFVWICQEISNSWNIQTSPSGTNNHAIDNIAKFTLFSHSDVYCEHYLKLWACICMTFALCSCYIIGWLENCIKCALLKAKNWHLAPT